VLPPVTRPDVPLSGDERTLLPAFLDYHRATLLWKCEQLDGEALAQRGVPPSPLSLLGIVRHMTLVEWSWFSRVFARDGSAAPIALEDDSDADFNDLDPARAMDDIALFERQCDGSRAIAGAAADLDVMAASTRRPVSLRWILVHMIEEYARHNGHADLLRERIDGAVGE
jgi:uncharacterized damage-inducible protein DinB